MSLIINEISVSVSVQAVLVADIKIQAKSGMGATPYVLWKKSCDNREHITN